MRAQAQYTIYTLNDVQSEETAPASPYLGQLWVDTSTSPPITRVWNGAEWVELNGTDKIKDEVKYVTDKQNDFEQSAGRYFNQITETISRVETVENDLGEVEEKYTKVSESVTKLEQTSKEITASVASIAVGGRNLLKGTRDFSGFRVYPDGFISIEENGDFSNARFNEDIPEGTGLKYVTSSPNPINLAEVLDQEVVFSFEIASPDDFKSAGDDIIVEFAVCGAENTTRLRYKLFYLETDVPTVWKQHVIKAKLTEDFFSGGDGNFSDATRFWVRFYSNSGNILYARKFKLELGNMATDWSANPEETEKSIASLKITADGISTDVKNAKGDIYKLSVKADEQATLIENAQGDATKALEKAGEVHTQYIKGDGVLSTDIDGTGLWAAKYTENGVVKSSVTFDLDSGLFKFKGELESEDGLTVFTVGDTGGMAVRKFDSTSGSNVAIGKIDFYTREGKYYPVMFLGDGSTQKSLAIQWYDDGIWIGNARVAQGGSFQANDGASGYFINTLTGENWTYVNGAPLSSFEAVFA